MHRKFMFCGEVGIGEPSRDETSLSPQRHLQPKRLRRREQEEEEEEEEEEEYEEEPAAASSSSSEQQQHSSRSTR